MKLDFEYGGRRYEGWTEADAVRSGVPANVIADANLNAHRGAVSAECRRRIYDAAPAESQMNMATAAAVISGKPASDRSDDENTIMEGVRLALNWVSDMRAAFASLSKDPDADYRADAAWPSLPPEVPALIERF